MILICGLPRAGKTTYSKSFENVIHCDDYGVMPIPLRYDKCAENVRTSKDIIIEGVYERSSYRKELVQAYQGTYTKCIWLDTPDYIRHERDGWSRNCDFPFEPPTYDEGWNEIIVVRGEEVIYG